MTTEPEAPLLRGARDARAQLDELRGFLATAHESERKLHARVAELERQLAEARVALKPFAEVAEFSEGDHRWAIKRGQKVRAITHQDLDRARAAFGQRGPA